MRLNEITNVIDFNKAKKARQDNTAVSVDFDLDKLGYGDQKHSDHVELLSDWITDQEASAIRVPRFNNLQTLFYYLTIELGMPSDPTRVERWFVQLSPDNQSKVKMLAHHSTRVIKVLLMIKAKIEETRRSIPSTSDAVDQLNYLDSQNDEQLTVMRALHTLV